MTGPHKTWLTLTVGILALTAIYTVLLIRNGTALAGPLFCPVSKEVCATNACSKACPGNCPHPLQSARFWLGFVCAAGSTGLFLAWETNLLSPLLRGPIRPPATGEELLFTALITLLIGFNAGLFLWNKRYGSCPTGTRRATGIATAFGALALLCPACTGVPLPV
jgi:hypothetical protein